jgi:hypothetical protein
MFAARLAQPQRTLRILPREKPFSSTAAHSQQFLQLSVRKATIIAA